jgi:hypothetical protein
MQYRISPGVFLGLDAAAARVIKAGNAFAIAELPRPVAL